MEHLKAEIADFLASGDSSRTVRFLEEGAFVVYEDISIPMGMNFTLSKGTLIVEDGVTMTIARGGTITAKNAQIDGTLSVSGTLSMSSASSELEVSGTLENKGSVVVLDTGFVRTENMTAAGGRYYVEHFAGDEAALRAACEIASPDSDSAVTHEIYPRAMIALSADLTIPANVRMRINSGTGVSTAAGVTLINLGEIVSKQSLQLLGTLLNDGTLTLMRGINAEFGTYDGSGTLKVYKDSSDPFTHLSGLDPDAFDSELGQDNYWALHIKLFGVVWLNGDGSVLWQTVVSYGTVPVYGGETPTKPFSTFKGWDPEPAAVTEDTVYRAVFETKDGWREIDGKIYYYGEDGKPVTYWQQIDGNWYHFSGSGVMDTGWLKSADKWYYLGTDGVMVTGFVTVSGQTYYMDENGAMLTGWQNLDGNWYYFKSSGAMAVGWLQISGKWYYFDAEGVMLRYWQQIGGAWYHFQSGGAMDTGWLKSDGNWYYLKSSGAMATGWQQVGSTWYYFNAEGKMQTGWQKIGSTWYYFKDSGAMVTGWQKIGSTWYYFQSSGAMKTGWLKLDGSWYYFEASGAMVTGSKTINGKTYNFNSSGVCLNP